MQEGAVHVFVCVTGKVVYLQCPLFEHLHDNFSNRAVIEYVDPLFSELVVVCFE